MEKELTALASSSHSHNHSLSNKHVQKMAKHCYEWLLIFASFFSYSLGALLMVSLKTVLVSPNFFHKEILFSICNSKQQMHNNM